LLTDKTSSGFKNLARLASSFGLSASDSVAEVGGKTEISATVNTSGNFLEGSGLDTVTLKDANVIKVSEGTDFDAFPLITMESKDSAEEEKKLDYLAVAATKNGAPRLVWLTAADEFANKYTESMSEDEIAEYTKAIYLTRGATQWLKVVFSSNLSEELDPPVPYSAQIISISTGVSVFVGCVFIFLVPIILIGTSYLKVRIRRKRSADALVTER
jgi:hypothetical protein